MDPDAMMSDVLADAVVVDLSDASPPSSALLNLPVDVLVNCLRWLPFRAVSVAMATCHTLRAAAMSREVWCTLLLRYFPDCVGNMDVMEDPLAIFRSIASILIDSDAARCNACGKSWLRANGRRCPCIVRHSRAWPLRLGALAAARSGSSSLASGGFDSMLALLRAHFEMTDGADQLAEVCVTNHRSTRRQEPLPFEALTQICLARSEALLARSCVSRQLTEAALRPLDLFILCTTEGPALSASEQAALRAWVEDGGALITSAFSNWSAFGHFAAETVGFLGLTPIPHAPFQPRLTHEISPSTPVDAETLLLIGQPLASSDADSATTAFGDVAHFVNVGESVFTVNPEAFLLGAVQLVTRRGQLNLLEQRRATLVWYPPRTPVTGKGRILVCSNLHWLVNSNYWIGGTLTLGGGYRTRRGCC